MKHSFALKQAVLFASIFGLSGGLTYYFCYQNRSTEPVDIVPPVIDEPLKPSEVLFTSLMSLDKFDIDASLEFTYQEDMTHGKIDIDGIADISDLSNLKITGDLDATYGSSHIAGTLGYFDSTIYLDYNQSHLKLEQTELFDFVDMLPTMGINIALPDEIKNLDLNAISSKLTDMEPVSCPDGYMFEFALNDTISLFFKSDFDYQFTGLRTNKFFYKDLFVFLDCDINSSSASTELVNPEKIENAPKYQSFRPALNLVNGLANVFDSKTNTFALHVNLQKQGESENEELIDLNGNLSYDLNNNAASLDVSISENERLHKLGLYLNNNALYLNQADINKISIQNNTILNLVAYLLGQINDDAIKSLLDDLTTSMSSSALTDVLGNLENLNSWITAIDVQENKVAITLDLSVFGLNINEIVIYASLDKQTLLGIHLDDYIYQGYIVNLDIDVKDFNLVVPDASEYVSLDPAVELVPTILDLVNRDQFRFEFNGEVDSSQTDVNPITINGGLQFDISNAFGYGSVSIVDRDAYTHNIEVDYRQDKTLLFEYNDKLRGKMDGAAIDDLSSMIDEIVNNKDDHFMELFGDILNTISATPLYQALNGDIGILFATDTFSNIQVTPTTIEFDLSGALVGLDSVMHIKVNYDQNNLYGIEITGLELGGETISLSVNLNEFDASLESTRLDPMGTYFDFSDIKLLLSLGITTSQFNDYHITGKVNLNLLGIINEDVPLDLKIKNDKGNVSLAVDLTDVPVIGLVNGNPDYTRTNSRTASIYYQDGLVYINRNDRVTDGLFFTKTYDVNYTSVCKLDYFMDNILYYFGSVIMGLKDWVMDQIQQSDTGSVGQIKYENILKDFYYNEEGSYFYIDVDIAEIAQNPDLQSLTIKIRVDKETSMLSGIDINFNISVGITIKLAAEFNLVDVGQEVNLTEMNNFIALHQNDELNVVNKTATRV